MKRIIIAILLAVVLLAAINSYTCLYGRISLKLAYIRYARIVTYEDGSWGLGKYPYHISGCLPNNECSDPESPIIQFELYPE